MARGLFVSVIAHAVIFGLGYIGLPQLAPYTDRAPGALATIQVDLAELNISAEPDPPVPTIKNNPPEQMAPAQIEDPAPETVPLPEDTVTIEPDQNNTQPDATQAEPEETIMADAETINAPETAPVDTPPNPLQRERAADALADLLNRSETTFKQARERQPPPDSQSAADTTGTQPPETTNKSAARPGAANIARLEAIVHDKVKGCWQGVDDLPHPEDLNVRILIDLSPDGEIAKLELLQPRRRPQRRSAMRIAIDRAELAVKQCEPYLLPKDDYVHWKQININLGLAFEPD